MQTPQPWKFEIIQIPDLEQRANLEDILRFAHETVLVDRIEIARSEHLESLGFIVKSKNKFTLSEAQNPSPSLARFVTSPSRWCIGNYGIYYKHYDALHIACAESGGADVLLTTDDRMLWLQKIT